MRSLSVHRAQYELGHMPGTGRCRLVSISRESRLSWLAAKRRCAKVMLKRGMKTITHACNDTTSGDHVFFATPRGVRTPKVCACARLNLCA